jgi:hypothetical protein
VSTQGETAGRCRSQPQPALHVGRSARAQASVGGAATEYRSDMSWLASPASSMLLGGLFILNGVVGVAADRSRWGFWIIGGAIGLASGFVRQLEVHRGRRFGGVPGALAWLSAPLWGKYRNARPPHLRSDRP